MKTQTEHVILVTGTNGGIGKMVVSHLLNMGHKNIICHYRSAKNEISDILLKHDLNPNEFCFQAELNDEDSVQKMGAEIRSRHGFVGAVVNIAGASSNSMSWKLSKKDFMKTIEDNLLSAFLCSREFIPDMREKQFGKIVNFSSVVGATGVIGAAHYCSAKAGIIGLTKALSKELAPKNISVNAIALGYFNAGLIESVPEQMKIEMLQNIPLKRFGEQSDIGGLVNYLLNGESNYISGQVLHLNGGMY